MFLKKFARTFLPLKKAVFLLLFFSGFCGTATADQPKKKLIVGFNEFAPFVYSDSKGRATGLVLEDLRKTLDKLNIEAEFTSLPYARLLVYLKAGKIDFWPGATKVPDLEGYVFESERPLFNITLCAFHLKETPSISSLEDFQNRSVILLNGFSYGGLIRTLTDPKSGIDVRFTPNHTSGLVMLDKKRGDYLIDYLGPVESALNDYPIPELQKKVMKTREAAFVMPNLKSENKALLQKIDQTFREISDLTE